MPIEAKQRARKRNKLARRVAQFSTYDQRADKLFMCHAFGVACNGRIAKYSIQCFNLYFNEWKSTLLDVSQTNPILEYQRFMPDLSG